MSKSLLITIGMAFALYVTPYLYFRNAARDHVFYYYKKDVLLPPFPFHSGNSFVSWLQQNTAPGVIDVLDIAYRPIAQLDLRLTGGFIRITGNPDTLFVY